MTLADIIQCAYYHHNATFTEADAQDVIDTKPEWAGYETVEQAVADYINAFGA